MEADLTVTKLSNDHLLVVVATDTQHNQVATRLRRHLCDGDDDRHRLDASILDVTGAYCQIYLQGPQSREFLQELTSQDLGNEAFPFRKVTEIDIGFARVIQYVLGSRKLANLVTNFMSPPSPLCMFTIISSKQECKNYTICDMPG